MTAPVDGAAVDASTNRDSATDELPPNMRLIWTSPGAGINLQLPWQPTGFSVGTEARPLPVQQGRLDCLS